MRTVITYTEKQAQRLRRAGYNDVLIKPAPGSSPRTSTPSRAPRRGEADLPASVKASIVGPALGRRWMHDALALARHLGLQVEDVPLASLQRRDRPNTTINGRLIGGRLIQLADCLPPGERQLVCAHEIGHHVLGVDADETDCDIFAGFFFQVAADETPAGRWRQMQHAAVEAQRRRAAAVAR